VDNGHFIGLVTLDDVRSVPRDEWETTSVRQVMTPSDQLIAVTLQDDAADALGKLVQADVRQLPVVDNGSLAGLLRRRDIVKWLQLESELNVS
jgi:CBS domain-containing protein